MNTRRATATFSQTAPPSPAALATIVVLALLLSHAAQRVMPPVNVLTSDAGVSVGTSPAIPETRRPAKAAAATPVKSAPANAAALPAGAAPAITVPAVAAPATGAAAQAAVLPPAIEDLRRRHLSLPVNGVRADQLVATFDEARGDRPHEAIDIMSPRGTPVIATEDGRVAKLFWSKAGGHTIYQFDPTDRYVYYYAHLDRYADGLAEGQTVTRGQTIGYVGSTGNAKADAPHLHFAIFLLTPEKRWWDGTALDPYPVLRWNIDGGTP